MGGCLIGSTSNSRHVAKISRAGLIARSGGVVDSLIGRVAQDLPSLAAPKFAVAPSRRFAAGRATHSSTMEDMRPPKSGFTNFGVAGDQNVARIERQRNTGGRRERDGISQPARRPRNGSRADVTTGPGHGGKFDTCSRRCPYNPGAVTPTCRPERSNSGADSQRRRQNVILTPVVTAKSLPPSRAKVVDPVTVALKFPDTAAATPAVNLP
jgi:hypothetical protein